MKKRKAIKNIEDNFIFDYLSIDSDEHSAIFRLNK